MTRRQFLASCVVLACAWLTGLSRPKLRTMLEPIVSPSYDDMPLGLMDVMESSSVHPLRYGSDDIEWTMIEDDGRRDAFEASYRFSYQRVWL